MATLNFNQVNIHSKPDQRSEAEERWVSFQPYLLSKGYRLRPRYQPDWVPMWKDKNVKPSDCEDSIDRMPIRVMDATRIEDGAQVIIKSVVPSEDDEGLEERVILEYFSTPPLRNHPSNHVVRCLDSFPIPGIDSGSFIIMPLLSNYGEIPFYNIAEIHEMLQQLFEGLLYIHENHIAHRDIASANIMMDAHPLYDEPFHPFLQTHSLDTQRLVYPRYRRSEKKIRYYYIDFGYAKWFQDPSASRLVIGMNAREPAPEQAYEDPYDPFIADLYQLGAVLRRDLIPVGLNFYTKFEFLTFLLPLAREMTRDNPAGRPTLLTARTSMNTAFLGIPGWKYRWPIVPKYAELGERWGYFWAGLTAEARFWFKRVLMMFLRY
ncbi:kinase-like domain-containing protein [Rhizoctonia solani]|nr:kinase-like domain-containing protein [Rhizoctonia solani]